jgi:hypothetical protein
LGYLSGFVLFHICIVVVRTCLFLRGTSLSFCKPVTGPALSYWTWFWRIILYLILLYLILLYHILLFLILSWAVVLYLIMSFPNLPDPILSFCAWWYSILFVILSYPPPRSCLPSDKKVTSVNSWCNNFIRSDCGTR